MRDQGMGLQSNPFKLAFHVLFRSRAFRTTTVGHLVITANFPVAMPRPAPEPSDSLLSCTVRPYLGLFVFFCKPYGFSNPF